MTITASTASAAPATATATPEGRAAGWLARGRAALRRLKRYRPKMLLRLTHRNASPIGASITPDALDKWSDARGKAVWQQRLRAVGYRAALIPVVRSGARFDHKKPLFVVVPGKGENLRDMREVVKAEKAGFQVVIAITDHTQSWNRNGKDLARAFEQLMQHRASLARAAGDPAPSRHVQLYGHSAGSMTLDRALIHLARKGKLRGDGKGLFSRVDQYISDGPTRGLDAPWLFKLPVIKQLTGLVLPRLPVVANKLGITPGVLSLYNRGKLMRALTRANKLPANVHTRLLAVVAAKPDKAVLGLPHPLANAYSHELRRGELRHLRDFLRRHRDAPNPLLDHGKLGKLAHTGHFGLTRFHGLANIMRMRFRAVGYRHFAIAVKRAALRPTSDAEFARAYDNALSRFVATFYGEHTAFHWTHKPGQTIGGDVRASHLVKTDFLGWITGELARNRADHAKRKAKAAR